MKNVTISMIAAMSKNRVIGHNNRIPWDIPEDMEYLRATTRGKPLIMGRSTYESVAGYRQIDPRKERPMPGRFNVLVTRNAEYFGENPLPKGVALATTPKDGLTLAFDHAQQEKIDEIFVFGGSQIYEELLPNTQRMYLTEIDTRYDGDSFFPDFERSEWQLTSSDQRDGFAFNVYDRKP
jgi:dihydrofolate reductase